MNIFTDMRRKFTCNISQYCHIQNTCLKKCTICYFYKIPIKRIKTLNNQVQKSKCNFFVYGNQLQFNEVLIGKYKWHVAKLSNKILKFVFYNLFLMQHLTYIQCNFRLTISLFNNLFKATYLTTYFKQHILKW